MPSLYVEIQISRNILKNWIRLGIVSLTFYTKREENLIDAMKKAMEYTLNVTKFLPYC